MKVRNSIFLAISMLIIVALTACSATQNLSGSAENSMSGSGESTTSNGMISDPGSGASTDGVMTDPGSTSDSGLATQAQPSTLPIIVIAALLVAVIYFFSRNKALPVNN